MNANGVTYPVTGAGIVALSPSLSLSNTLLVPFLSNKLTFVGQVTEELNCVALMYPTFCLFQDILTKEIVSRGTKKGGGGGGYITWMISTLVRLVICIMQALKRNRLGSGIDAWGIRRLAI